MKTNWVSNLKEVRNSKNLTLDSCSKETNVPVDFLVNLESGNFKKLPPAVFTKFHIKRYFVFLDLDPSSCLADYEEFISKQEKRNRKKDLKVKEIQADKNRNLYKIYTGITVFIISVLAVIYLLLTDTENQDQSLVDETSISIDKNDELSETDLNLFEENNIETFEASEISEASDEFILQENLNLIDIPLKINLEIKGESWIVLEDKNERMLYELMQTGSYELRGSPPFTFKVGYAPAVEIFIDGNKINFNNFINKSSNYAAFYTMNGKDVEKVRN